MAHDAPWQPAQAAGDPQYRVVAVRGAGEADLDADTIVAENRQDISHRRLKDLDTEAPPPCRCHGTTVAPGLIAATSIPSPAMEPRQNQTNWIDSYLHGGVTTMISGRRSSYARPSRDVVGHQGMAIFAQRSF